MNGMRLEPGILCLHADPDARMRLFCFSFAGGSARFYDRWPELLGPKTELYAVELPGRGTRFTEPSHTQLPDIVAELTRAILPLTDKPFAFFGHSMGALISFETARELRRQHGKTLSALYVSAFPAPQLPREQTARYLMSDRELIEELRQLNGTPAKLLEHAELMELILPIMRADLEVCETYAYQAEEPLPFPITAFGGSEDPGLTQEDLRAWREQTQGAFQLRMFAGDHFFVDGQRANVMRVIREQLATLAQEQQVAVGK